MGQYEKDVALAVNRLRAVGSVPVMIFGHKVSRSQIAGTFRIEGIDGIHAIHGAARRIVEAHYAAVIVSR